MKKMNLTGAVSLVNSTANMALTLVPTENGLRTRLSAQLWEELGTPATVEVLQMDQALIILPARENAKLLKVGKGRYLYDTATAKAIAKLAGIDLESNESKSVQVGSYEINTLEDDENFKVAVISFDHQSE